LTRRLLLLSPVCFSHAAAAPRALLSFPTRRSSDLRDRRSAVRGGEPGPAWRSCRAVRGPRSPAFRRARSCSPAECRSTRGSTARSEEHTSELQSLTNLVCRLLLAKTQPTPTPHAPP